MLNPAAYAVQDSDAHRSEQAAQAQQASLPQVWRCTPLVPLTALHHLPSCLGRGCMHAAARHLLAHLHAHKQGHSKGSVARLPNMLWLVVLTHSLMAQHSRLSMK